jgi:peptidylprolyl isomerase/peptidyl-prolyl cis-trans isomerase D
MAVLNKIRQRSIFLIIIIALALFSFVLADVIQNGGFSSQKSQNTIASINGTDLSREEFARKVDDAVRNLGPNATNAQAMNMVWNNELRSVLLREQFDELGLTVGADQLRSGLAQNLSNNPAFLNEAGVFDNNKLQEYIADVKANDPLRYSQFVEFEQSIMQNIKEQTYFNMVKAGLMATTSEGAFEYKIENDKADIEFVQIPYTSIPDAEITVTNEDITAYIKKNEKRFQTEAAVDIQYVFFAEDPSQEDDQVVKNEIESLLSQKIEFNAISKQNDTLVGFRETQDHIGFVAQNSEVQFQDRWWFKKDLPVEIADTIFAMNVGDVYGPFKLENSYNLSKLVAVKQLADSVQAKHVLISWDALQSAGQTSRTKEQAKTLADSLLNVIRKDVSKFEVIASEFSDDPSVAENKGDLGFLNPGSTIEAFDNYIFDNQKGDKSVVESDFGYHVIVIEDQKNIQKAVKIANITKTVVPSEETTNKIFVEATQFEARAASGDFANVSKENELDLRPVNKIGELEENIPGIGNNRNIVSWAYEKNTKVGDVKRFNINNGYAIVQLTNKSEKGLMSAAEASAQVTPILRNEKKAKQIRETVKGNTLEEIAQEKNTQVKTANAIAIKTPTLVDAGTEPKVVGAAFGIKEGQTSGWIDGRNGVYKIRVLARRDAPATENYASYVAQLNTKRATGINANVFSALKKNAKIEDRRASFY